MLMDNLDVRDRTQAVVVALQKQLLPTQPTP